MQLSCSYPLTFPHRVDRVWLRVLNLKGEGFQRNATNASAPRQASDASRGSWLYRPTARQERLSSMDIPVTAKTCMVCGHLWTEHKKAGRFAGNCEKPGCPCQCYKSSTLKKPTPVTVPSSSPCPDKPLRICVNCWHPLFAHQTNQAAPLGPRCCQIPFCACTSVGGAMSHLRVIAWPCDNCNHAGNEHGANNGYCTECPCIAYAPMTLADVRAAGTAKKEQQSAPPG